MTGSDAELYEARCDECQRLMYRASTHGVHVAQGDETSTRPIKLKIGDHGFMLCSRECLHALVTSLSDKQLFEGGYPLPWGA